MTSQFERLKETLEIFLKKSNGSIQPYHASDLFILDNLDEMFENDNYLEIINTILAVSNNPNKVLKFHPNFVLNHSFDKEIKILENDQSVEELILNFKFNNIYTGISTTGLYMPNLFNIKPIFYTKLYKKYKLNNFYVNRIKMIEKLFDNETN